MSFDFKNKFRASSGKQTNLPGLNRADHRNLGKNFEAEIEAVNDFYRMQGIVDVVKNPNEWRYCSFKEFSRHEANRSRIAARTCDSQYLIMQSSDVDFSGGNDRGSYVFDTKETAKESFPLTSVRDNQLIRLRQSAKCGTIAGFLVKFTALDRVFFAHISFIDEKFVQWKKQTGRRAAPGTASISFEEMQERAVEVFRAKNGLWDWYKAIGKS
jgi:recombination protein U